MGVGDRPSGRVHAAAIAAGVSTRRYAATLDPLPAEVMERGTSSSAVSRRFVALSSTRLRTFLSRLLGELNLRVVCIDGKVFREHCMVVALGIEPWVARCAGRGATAFSAGPGLPRPPLPGRCPGRPGPARRRACGRGIEKTTSEGNKEFATREVQQRTGQSRHIRPRGPDSSADGEIREHAHYERRVLNRDLRRDLMPANKGMHEHLHLQLTNLIVRHYFSGGMQMDRLSHFLFAISLATVANFPAKSALGGQSDLTARQSTTQSTPAGIGWTAQLHSH